MMRIRQMLASNLIALAATAVMSAAVPAAAHAATDAAVAAQGTGAGARYIVQAATTGIARRDVARVGAKTEQDLAIIHAVAAYLNPWQVKRLRKTDGVRVFEDRSLATDGL